MSCVFLAKAFGNYVGVPPTLRSDVPVPGGGGKERFDNIYKTRDRATKY